MENVKDENKLYRTFKVKLTGKVPILFNRFRTMDGETAPEDKLHLEGKKIIVPSELIYAFFFQEKPGGCAQRFEGKAYKAIAKTGIASMGIEPTAIPLTSNGEEIIFDRFDKNGVDEKSGVYIHESIITNPKPMIVKRPAIDNWGLEFTITLYKNDKLQKDKLQGWLERGGSTVGLGSYRPRYGRFDVKFEEIK